MRFRRMQGRKGVQNMKKKIIMSLMMFAFLVCAEGVIPHSIAKANEMQIQTVNYITMVQSPAKTTYNMGEELDLTGMLVQAYYSDGTVGEIKDYAVTGYNMKQLGTQTVIVTYQNYVVSFNINVLPPKVKNIKISSHSTSSYTLVWDAIPDVIRYDIYSMDEFTGNMTLISSTPVNSVTYNEMPGKYHKYAIRAVLNLSGMEYAGELSDLITAGTDPEAVTGLIAADSTANAISLTWSPVTGAAGYVIYRASATGSNYTRVGTTNIAAYLDTNLSSGTGYKYKVCAYTVDETFVGLFSPVVTTSTDPAKAVVKYKAGEEKIRLSWAKLTGATAYDIIIYDQVNETSRTITNKGNTNCSYLAEGLITGNSYSISVIAKREYNGMLYTGDSSNIISVTMTLADSTSDYPLLFEGEEGFQKSYAYSKLPFFTKNVNYDKSYIIPGLVTTNVGGFNSTSMVPQGTTFAEGYLLLSAYDGKNEENSVIYVIDKVSNELLTTLILPSKTHVGGIAYDGTNIWVPTGTKVSSILFTDIDEAAQNRLPYAYVTYNSTYTLEHTASFLTYYKERLWIGTYNELESTYLYSYDIEDKEESPSLSQSDAILMPNRLQGVAFTNQGTLILSRSCQTKKGMRGYLRQLDVYKPNFAGVKNGIIPLGKCINSVEMPSMNEEIAIDGNYLYVNFESGAFANSSYKMDRVCAFKLTSITKKSALSMK